MLNAAKNAALKQTKHQEGQYPPQVVPLHDGLYREEGCVLMLSRSLGRKRTGDRTRFPIARHHRPNRQSHCAAAGGRALITITPLRRAASSSPGKVTAPSHTRPQFPPSVHRRNTGFQEPNRVTTLILDRSYPAVSGNSTRVVKSFELNDRASQFVSAKLAKTRPPPPPAMSRTILTTTCWLLSPTTLPPAFRQSPPSLVRLVVHQRWHCSDSDASMLP